MSRWIIEKWSELTEEVMKWAKKNAKKQKWAAMDCRTYIERGSDEATTNDQRKDLWSRIRATGKGIDGFPVLSVSPSDLPQFLQDSLDEIGKKRITNFKNRFKQTLTGVCEIRNTRPKDGEAVYYHYKDGNEYAATKWAGEMTKLIQRWKKGDWDGTMKDLMCARPNPKEDSA